MIEDKINLFLEELENKGIEINGETVFICNDGAVLFIPTEEGTVNITLVRNPVKIDYNIGITDADVEMWKVTGELAEELGGEVEDGGDR